MSISKNLLIPIAYIIFPAMAWSAPAPLDKVAAVQAQEIAHLKNRIAELEKHVANAPVTVHQTGDGNNWDRAAFCPAEYHMLVGYCQPGPGGLRGQFARNSGSSRGWYCQYNEALPDGAPAATVICAPSLKSSPAIMISK